MNSESAMPHRRRFFLWAGSIDGCGGPNGWKGLRKCCVRRLSASAPDASLLRSGPDATVVRWYGQRVLLERRHPFEIESAAVQFFDIVAAHWKPK